MLQGSVFQISLTGFGAGKRLQRYLARYAERTWGLSKHVVQRHHDRWLDGRDISIGHLQTALVGRCIQQATENM